MTVIPDRTAGRPRRSGLAASYTPSVDEERLPRGPVTFLLSDIEGSTRLVEDAGPGYGQILATVRATLRSAVATHGGAEVDATGDALLAAFPDAGAAVSAAIQAQRELQQEQWPDDRRVRVRMGLHAGMPELGAEGYVGLDVVAAARVGDAAHGGQIVGSSETLAATGAVTLALGTFQLPGLREPIAISQVLADGLPRDFPPLRNTVSQLGAGIRVGIAEDSVLLREGVARLLTDCGFEIVSQAATADDLLRHVALHRPHVVITDVRMPPTHTDEGLRAAMEIRAEHPETAVLVLSQYVESGYAGDLLAQPTGVGYLLKDRVADLDEFANAVRRVADGGSAIDPAVVAEILGRRRIDDPLAALTPREREVLELIAEGRSNQGIADRLFVTLRAVEKHVTNIFEKLGLPAGADDHRRVLAVLKMLQA